MGSYRRLTRLRSGRRFVCLIGVIHYLISLG
jgi:hypothetical protein